MLNEVDLYQIRENKRSIQEIYMIVSIIIPNYNNEKYIEFAINSILNQSYTNFELIIVDDNSRDSSVEIVKQLQQRDDRIKLIENSKNCGRSISRNNALDYSSGEYVAFCDGDDAWCENKLEIMIERMENDKDIDMMFSDSYIVDENGGLVVNSFYDFFKLKKHFSTESIKENLYLTNFINTPTVVIRNKPSIKRIRFDKNLKYLEDWIYWFEISQCANKIEFINQPLSFYRVHSNNSWKDLSGFNKCRVYCIKYILKSANLTNGAKSCLYYILGMTLLSLKKQKIAGKYLLRSFLVAPYRLKPLIRFLLLYTNNGIPLKKGNTARYTK